MTLSKANEQVLWHLEDAQIDCGGSFLGLETTLSDEWNLILMWQPGRQTDRHVRRGKEKNMANSGAKSRRHSLLYFYAKLECVDVRRRKARRPLSGRSEIKESKNWGLSPFLQNRIWDFSLWQAFQTDQAFCSADDPRIGSFRSSKKHCEVVAVTK